MLADEILIKPKIFDEQTSISIDYYPWTQDFIRTAWFGHWTDTLFNFSSDKQDFKIGLTDQEREIIVRSLAMISQVEVKVKKFWAKLGDNCPHPTLVDLGYVLAQQEVIHNYAYKRLLGELGINSAIDDILKIDIINNRVKYLGKHSHKFHADNKKQFIYSLILFTIFVENISLFSQFYVISWFGRFKNVLKDTNKQIEYTSREELLHFNVGAKLINTIRKEYPELFDEELKEKIIHESTEAIKYECEIVDWYVNGYGEDTLNSDLLKDFIKNRMNNSLVEIGYDKIFDVNIENIRKAKWFDEQILGNNQTDFFHGRPVEYSKGTQSFSEEDLF